jgi:hypothetical protein
MHNVEQSLRNVDRDSASIFTIFLGEMVEMSSRPNTTHRRGNGGGSTEALWRLSARELFVRQKSRVIDELYALSYC